MAGRGGGGHNVRVPFFYEPPRSIRKEVGADRLGLGSLNPKP